MSLLLTFYRLQTSSVFIDEIQQLKPATIINAKLGS